MYIAIFEDDKDTAISLMELAKELGYSTSRTDNCGAAKRILKAFKPDIVIVDLYLRDGCCVEILEQIANDYNKDVHVIVISARNDALNLLKNYHYNHFMHKPFNLEDIQNRMLLK